MKRKTILLILCMALCFTFSGSASAQCIPDSHNDATSALEIGYDETVTDYVCPDDRFDYYYFDIPDDADVSGMITFAAEQSGTTLRIDGPPGSVFPERGTLDSERTFWVPIAAGSLPPGRYYLRISHYSSYATDHEYTITMDLTLTGGSSCVPDGNDDPADASELAFDTTVEDWVCSEDHLDIWHFTVTDTGEGKGTINLSADPGELVLYIYDETATEIYNGRTSGGTIEYALDASGSALTTGDYYIGVFLPLARDDENSYILQLRDNPGIFFENLPIEASASALAGLTPPPRNPWPVKYGNMYNDSLSTFQGPASAAIRTMLFDDDLLTKDEMGTHHRKYGNIIVSAHRRIFIMDITDRRIIAVNSVTGDIEWEKRTFSYDPPCLGNNNDIYFLDSATDSLVGADMEDGEIWWSRHIEETGHHSVQMVGTYVYTAESTPWGSDDPMMTHVQAWNIGDGTHPERATGARVWEVGPISGYITGVIEDARGYVYIQTHTTLCKLDLDGNFIWTRPIHDPEEYNSEFGPCLDPRGRVWVHFYWSGKYVVYDKDGFIYKTGDYGFRPHAICFDHRGRTYVADNDRVVCYEDYDEILWTSTMDSQYVDDMALGTNDILYITRLGRTGPEPDGPFEYKADLILLDVDDGHELSRHALDIYTDQIDLCAEYHGAWKGSEVAIGEGKKVVCLQMGGTMEVFGELLIMLRAYYALE